MPRIVTIDAVGIVARARAMMPQDLPAGAPHDAAVIRKQIAWAHAIILSGSRCPKSDPAFRARCVELLEVLDALRMAWACHFHMNWKTGAPIDPRLVHPIPLDHVILSARCGPFQLYRYEPVRRIARSCRVIEATAEAAKKPPGHRSRKDRPRVRLQRSRRPPKRLSRTSDAAAQSRTWRVFGRARSAKSASPTSATKGGSARSSACGK